MTSAFHPSMMCSWRPRGFRRPLVACKEAFGDYPESWEIDGFG